MEVTQRLPARHFGELLLRHRRAAALGQRELAGRSGLSERAIRDLERGVRTPRQHSVHALAAALRLTGDDRAALLAAARSGDDAGPAPERSLAVSGSLRGRDAELRTLLDLVTGGRHRLITVAGPAGVGKSRLAAELATVLGHRQVDVYAVDLSAVAQSELVAEHAATAVGCGPSRLPPVDRIAARLRDRRAVLLLDRVELLTAAAADLLALLRRCPRLAVVLTSQRPLGVRDEHLLRLGPLAPDAAHALFAERAAAARPGCAVTAATVATICRRVDHLPLAIELAAARVRFLHPAELAARLDRQLPMLVDGAADRPARHRSLRAAILSNLGLVPPDGQWLFDRLGVFPAGARLDDVEAVAAALGMPGDRVLTAVAELADTGLLRSEFDHTGSRHTLPDAMAELAHERLAADPAARSAAVAAMAGHYVARLAYTVVGGLAPLTARDGANVRAAISQHAETRPAAVTPALVGAVCRYFEATSRFADGEDLLIRTARAGHPAAWTGAGQLAGMRGDPAAARIAARHALAGLTDPIVQVPARLVLARALADGGEPLAARTELRRALRDSRRAGDLALTGRVFNNLAAASESLGRPRDAERQLLAALTAKRRGGAGPIDVGRTWYNLAEIAAEDGRHDTARDRADRAAGILGREQHQLAVLAGMTGALARVHLGEYAGALAVARRAAGWQSGAGDDLRVRLVIELRHSVVEHAAGELSAARTRLRTALVAVWGDPAGDRPATLRSLPADDEQVLLVLRMHAYCLVHRDPATAVALLAAAAARAARPPGADPARVAALVAGHARRLLGGPGFTRAYAHGARLDTGGVLGLCERIAVP